MRDGRLIVAGLLGGSGNHVVQIVIGVVVVVALIGYFLLRLGGRVGGGDARAVAAAVSQHQRERATSDATLLLVRTWGLAAHSEQWNIVIDRAVVGSIADKETVEVAVEPGHHMFRLEFGQTPQRRAFVRRRVRGGRHLPLQQSEGLATAGGGIRQAGPMDLAPARGRLATRTGSRTPVTTLKGWCPNR